MLDVVVIGHLSIDEVEVKGKKNRQMGGAAVYASMSAKTFASVGVVSRIGRDFPHEFLRVLSSAGIDTNGIKKANGESTFFSITYNEIGAARYNCFKLNAGKGISPKDIPISYLKAKAFHIAPMNPEKQRRILEFIRKESKEAKISLNTYMGYVVQHKKALFELMKLADIFTMNDDEAMELTNSRSLEHALNAIKRAEKNIVIVTMGVYGSIVIKDSEINFFPSVYQPKIVDLTGCGDSFAGAFLAIYQKTKDAMKAANIANSMASINATEHSFNAIKALEFKNLENFQVFITSRQRKLTKRQETLEHFFG